MITKIVKFGINYIKTDILKMRIKPRVLQMPLTGKCNSRCITCNVWKFQKDTKDLSPKDLKIALSDPFFSEVRAVGLNGGEPTLYRQVDDLLTSLFVLKKLNRLHVISNGMLTNRLVEMMSIIKNRCKEQGIKVYLTISLDGVGKIHNQVRGIRNVFERTLNTIKEMRDNKDKYCDVLDLGFTVSNGNVDSIVETEAFISTLGVPAYYHPAVPNNRLHNFDVDTEFSIMNNKRSILLATEYFYGKFKSGNSLKTKLRSFLTYFYLKSGGNERLAGCNYLRSDVTITENLDICLCATASKIIGNLKDTSATSLMYSPKAKQEEHRVSKLCNGCVHYIIFPTFKGIWAFVLELLKPSIWLKYKWRAIWLK